jgi:stringent starvation protein B
MTAAVENQGTSTRPYLLRALHDWCTDNGFTPYIAVHVDAGVQVPREYVKNDEIVLNIGFEATSGLKLGNEFVEFRARFGGVARDIVVPVDHVVAIYARENGQGMAFPMPVEAAGSEPARARGPTGVAGATGATGLAGAPAPRGLRLAGTEPPESPKSLDPSDASGASGAPGATGAPAAGSKAGASDGTGAGAEDDEPTDPSTPGGGRPALKRVK